MKRALVAFIAKVEGVVRKKFLAPDPVLFCPPIKNPGRATFNNLKLHSSDDHGSQTYAAQRFEDLLHLFERGFRDGDDDLN